MEWVGAVDLGGTKLLAALVDRGGQVVAREQTGTRVRAGPEAVVADMAAALRRLQAAAGAAAAARPAAIGLSVPGPLDPESGVVLQSPNLGWWDFPLLQQMADHFPGVPLALDDDARAAAAGEAWLGAGAGYRHFVYVIVGTGIGGGLWLDGRIYRGAGAVAGELGHQTVEPGGPPCGCGKYGCLEALAAGPAIVQRARQLLRQGRGGTLADLAGRDPERVTVELVAQAARGGDSTARALFHRIGTYLGIGIANVVQVLNPQAVVLGGGLTATWELWEGALRQSLAERTLVSSARALELVPGRLGTDAGVLGAARMAWAAVDGAG